MNGNPSIEDTPEAGSAEPQDEAEKLSVEENLPLPTGPSEPGQATDRLELHFAGQERSSEIIIRRGLLGDIATECRRIFPESTRYLLVTDSHLLDLYGHALMQALQNAGCEATLCVIPAGENSKSLAQAEAIYKTAMQAQLSRKDVFIALGGGVVGDLTGFCAATFHRGTAVIQVPTSLIAQVDSAIGGKTAVNFGSVKNVVGTFYQPRLILSDPQALLTLPERELAAGLAEVVKYGLIETACTGESGFFEWLCGQGEALPSVFPEMIRRCCAIKAAVVTKDEHETLGLRHFLNLGHTFGHAYEALSNYSLLHGEAVAIGLLKAAFTAQRLDMFPMGDVQRLSRLLQNVGLSAAIRQAGCFAPQALLNRMRQDKKNESRRIRLILPKGEPGRVVARDDVPDDLILSVLTLS